MGIFPLIESSRDLAPYGLAITPSASFLGRRKQDFLRFLADQVLFRKPVQLFRKLLKTHGIRAAKFNIADLIIEHSDVLPQNGTPGFEYRDCHGANGAGRVVLDNPVMGRLVARNLTRGKGGLPAGWEDDDWLRTLKHGVNREGKPLWVMPAHETTRIADAELADIIAYCKSRPRSTMSSPGNNWALC